MATIAKLVLNYSPSYGPPGAYFTIKLSNTSYSFTRIADAGNPGVGQFNSAESLRIAIEGRAGGNYTVTRNLEQITVTANNYGSIYDFGTVYSNGEFSGLVNSQIVGTGTPFTVNHTQVNVAIKGTSTGSINLTATGGNSPYTYSWNDGPTTQNRTGLAAGSYLCNVTEAGGKVTGSGYIVITEPAFTPINVDGSSTIVHCFTGSTGTITVTASGGTNIFTYLWNDGSTTQNRSGIPTGVYTVTVTDSAGNTGSKTFNVGQNTEIVVVATVAEDSVTLAISGGTAPFSFLWSDGATTQNRTGLAEGPYSCVITDSLGCTKSVNVNIRVFKFYFSKNPITLPLQALNPLTKPNLSFLCELWIELDYLSDNFIKVNVQEQPASLTGSTVFNVQSILDTYLEAYLPEGVETTVTRADSIFKRFYLRYTEKFGIPPVPTSYTQVDISYVVLGGLSFEEYAADTFFDTYLETVSPFFSWEPVDKVVFEDQPEYLFYMHNTFDYEDFHWKVSILYTDGTFYTHHIQSFSNANRFEVYCIPTGYQQMDIGSYDPAKTVAFWQVFLTDGDNVRITEVRTYRPNREYNPYKRTFLYVNSIGGINTLVATGQAAKELDPEDQQVEKILPYNYKISAGEVTTVKKMAKASLQCVTGYLTDQQLEALQDFIISDTVYYLDNGNANPGINPVVRYIAGPIEAKKFKALNEAETLTSLEFEFTLPKVYRYTPRL